MPAAEVVGLPCADETGGERDNSARHARVVAAMAVVVAEKGYAGTSVSGICRRAAISHSTFYEMFKDRQDCFRAVIDLGYERSVSLIANAFEIHSNWLDGVRAALTSLLGLFEEESLLARVWFVEVLAAGSWALEHRQRHFRILRDTIVERWIDQAQPSDIAIAGVMEMVMGTIHARLIGPDSEPLTGLLGPLMGLIASICLGPEAAAAEIARCEVLAADVFVPEEREWVSAPVVPRLLLDPRAHRVRACLFCVQEQPGASNRQIARAVGIDRAGQISRLLTRLEAIGLLSKCQGAPGRPNNWTLTTHGIYACHFLKAQTSGKLRNTSLSSIVAESAAGVSGITRKLTLDGAVTCG